MGMKKCIEWPHNKKFAFTIIDDTDNGTIENIKPVYDLLEDCNILTTKTVWIYPSRDNFKGQCLLDDDYHKFIQELNKEGYEIALHSVGSGNFTRDEILDGYEIFRKKLGFLPSIQINHANNPDSIYWGYKRFTAPIRWLYKMIEYNYKLHCGDEIHSENFWGDLVKKNIKYIRNHTFNGINTMKYDWRMPYRVKAKDEFSNYWFSSSDAHTINECLDLLDKNKIDKLENEGGCCIVYTHFASGYVDKNGKLNPSFEENIRYLSQKDGWFVPAGELLDYLTTRHASSRFVPFLYRLRLDVLWIKDRIIKKMKYKR